MKKSLSIALSLLLMLSCISVLFGITAVAAPGENHTVTASIEAQDGLYGGIITTEANQSIAHGDAATVTVKPYYGNTFLGWFNGNEKVSDKTSYTFVVENDVTLTAKFNVYNQVVDGSFESGTDAGKDFFNGKKIATNSQQNTVIANPTASTAIHGGYVLQAKPATAANDNRALIGIPFKVKKNTRYVMQLSYYSKDVNNTAYISLHSNKAYTNSWTNSAAVSTFSYHWEKEGSTNLAAWSVYGGVNGTYYIQNKQTHSTVNAGANSWIDLWFTFDSGESDTIFATGENTADMFFVFGVGNSSTNTYYVDNVSITEAGAGANTDIQAVADANGKVAAAGGVESVCYADNGGNAKGSVSTAYAGSVAYSKIPTHTYTATPDNGYEFIGWFDADSKLVSQSATETFYAKGTYTAKFASVPYAKDGGYIEKNYDDTYTATAFYGNKFLGWYNVFDQKVSDDATYAAGAGYYALFDNHNQIFDGDFETGNPDTDAFWQNLPHYGANVIPTYKVTKNPVKNSDASFGNNVLMITPSSNTDPSNGANDKQKGLLNLPVDIVEGETYIWRFSYAMLSPYDASTHFFQFAVDDYNNGSPQWNKPLPNVSYSVHSQLHSYKNVNENPVLNDVWDYIWSWNTYTSATQGAYKRNQNASGGNEWVDFYIIFKAPSTGKAFLTLGLASKDITFPIVFDNMSFTKVNDGAKKPTVTAGEHGTVTSDYAARVPAFESKVPAASNLKAFEDVIDPAKPLYSTIYTHYIAKADAGYLFDGWYNAEDQRVSTEKDIYISTTDGGTYIAKFVYDPNRYYATAEVKAQDGRFGGYIEGEKEFNEIVSGASVKFTAVAYDGNVFEGWYDGGDKVGDTATIDYVLTKNTDLVAKFTINNLFPNAGFENSTAGDSVLGSGKLFTSSNAEAYGNVVNNTANTGSQGINIGNAGYDTTSKSFAVSANKDYHLAFNWLQSKTDEGYGIEYVKVFAAGNATPIAEMNTFTAATEGWQKVFLNFNTGAATEVYFTVKYKGASSSLYLDNFVLFDTSATPFVIKSEMEMDDIYPGYLTTDAIQNVTFGGNVSVSVKTYTANKFLGWYKDGVKVSSNATYSFTANEFATLTAKFEINNLITDSGYENSKIGLSLSDLGLWSVNESQKAQWGFDVWYASTAETPFTGNNGLVPPGHQYQIYAHDGDQLFKATHRNGDISTTLTGLKINTNYVFTYYWQIQNLGNHNDTAYLATTKLVGAQTSEELGAGRASGLGAGAEIWQKVSVPFFSGLNTEVNLTINYHAGSGDFYIDDMALYESDYITLVESEGGSIDTTFNDGESGPAQRGDEIVLNAVADPGYEFIGWYDYTDVSKVFSTNTTYKFNANGAVAIMALFNKIGSTDDPINYFVDGDFENNCMIAPTFDHKNFGTEWCTYGISGATGVVSPYSGDKFLRITSYSRYANFLVSNLEPYTTYTVSMAYYAPEYVSFEYIDVFERRREWERRVERDPNGGYQVNPARTYSVADRVAGECLGYIDIRDTDTQGKWQKLEFTITTNNRTEAYMQFSYSRARVNGDLYLDDIQIKKTSGGYGEAVGTIENADFESTNTLDGWMGDFATATGDSTYAVLTTGQEIKNNINLKRFTDYTVSFKARSDSDASLAYGITRGGIESLYDGDVCNAWSGYSQGVANLTSDWQEYSFTVSSTDVLQYSLFVKSMNGEAQIDDFKIKTTSELKNIDKVGFESNEGLAIRDASIQLPTTSLTTGSGDWQATDALNKRFYELYTANGDDEKVHSGNGSLIMKAEPSTALNDTEKGYYDANGTPFLQKFAWFQLQFGKAYEISYWVKAAEADTTFKSMLVQTDASWYLTGTVEEEVTAGTEWKKVTHKIIIDENIQTGPGLVRLVFNRIDGDLKSDVYIDDIQIVQTASAVVNENQTNVYTQDITQNYLENYSFEKAEGALGAFAKTDSNSVDGNKIGAFKAGDKVIVPVNTRTNYQITFAEEYTLAASVRGNASAKGGIYVAVDPEGKDILCSFKTDEIVSISPNTDGKWKRSAFTFTDERHTTLYLIIECKEGNFDVDYLQFFNADYGYKNDQRDNALITFDKNDASNYIDANANVANNISGVITGLPSGSKVILKGDKTYIAAVAADGTYKLNKVANGTYNMYVAGGDAELLTLWGDLTVEDNVYSGLACERLNGDAVNVYGQGVRNGIVKITDSNTEWSYLTATNENGEYNAYILDGNWYIEGTTNESAALKADKVTLEQFRSGNGSLEVAVLEDSTSSGGNTMLIICIAVMIAAAATLVFARKKGVSR